MWGDDLDEMAGENPAAVLAGTTDETQSDTERTAADAAETPEERLIQILRRPAWLRLRLADLTERRETCRAWCCRTTARYGGQAVSGGGTDRGDRSLLELAEWDRKIHVCRRKLDAASRTAEELVDQVSRMPGRTALRDAELLRLRYIRGLTGEELRLSLAQAGYPGCMRALYAWGKTARRRGAAAMERGRTAARITGTG